MGDRLDQIDHLEGHFNPVAAAGLLYNDWTLYEASVFYPKCIEWEVYGSSNDTVVKTSDAYNWLFPDPVPYTCEWGLFMGYGNDTATGWNEDDLIWGDHGDDTLKGGAGDDEIDGQEDNDRVWGGDGNDTLARGSGNDQVWGDAGDDNIHGNDGADKLYGGAGNDKLFGDDGADWLDGHAGTDVLTGGKGNDRYFLRQGDNDTVVELADSAVEGVDRVDFTGTSYTLAANVEDLYLSGGYGTGATLSGNADNNRITALGGNDTIYGKDGNDTIYGGDGADTVDGGNGNDSIYGGNGNDTLLGGADNDYLDGEAGADRMTGGLGDDTFVVDDAGDLVIEGLNEGIDTVYSGIASYTMTARLCGRI